MTGSGSSPSQSAYPRSRKRPLRTGNCHPKLLDEEVRLRSRRRTLRDVAQCDGHGLVRDLHRHNGTATRTEQPRADRRGTVAPGQGFAAQHPEILRRRAPVRRECCAVGLAAHRAVALVHVLDGTVYDEGDVTAKAASRVHGPARVGVPDATLERARARPLRLKPLQGCAVRARPCRPCARRRRGSPCRCTPSPCSPRPSGSAAAHHPGSRAPASAGVPGRGTCR